MKHEDNSDYRSLQAISVMRCLHEVIVAAIASCKHRIMHTSLGPVGLSHVSPPFIMAVVIPNKFPEKKASTFTFDIQFST